MSLQRPSGDLRFRDPAAIRARIRQLLDLCGEDPSAAFAAQYDALPVIRDLTGWTGLRPDGTFIFVDEATGRVVTELPRSLLDRAGEAAGLRFPELLAGKPHP